MTDAVDGGDPYWVKIGAFVMDEGTDEYVLDNRSGNNMLNARWPSKLYIHMTLYKALKAS